MGLFGQTKQLSGRSNVPSTILIRIPLIFLILLVYKYFELVPQVNAVLGKAIYAHDSFPADKWVLRKNSFLAIY